MTSITAGLWIEVDFALPALRVIRGLNQIIEWRRKPECIRCDNVPDFIGDVLEELVESHQIQFEFMQPGNPQQNAYVKRCNRTVRYSWLS